MGSKIIDIFMYALAVATCVVGLICIYYDRIPEGLIIIGSTIITLVVFRLSVNVFPSNRNILATAGNDMVILTGLCRHENEHSKECTFRMCDNGLIIEQPKGRLTYVPYEDVRLEPDGNIYHICFKIRKKGCYRFVCNNRVKVKAVNQIMVIKTRSNVLI